MQPACIRHTDLPGTSQLFADLAYRFDRVARFYQHDPHDPESFQRAAAQIQYPDDRRAALVAALRSQNGDSESLRKLARPGTVAVVTGQQVGLFSGPAYTIYKAMTAAQVARQLSARGIPAVPVFWLATEDHDFAEVNHAWVFGSSSEPTALRVGAPKEFSGKPKPVGRIPLINPPLHELRAALAGLPYTDEVMGIVDQAYRPGAAMGSAFRALLKTLLAKLDLIYLDPLDPAIRKIGAPFLAQALTAVPDLKAGFLARNKELSEAGYHAQVHVDAKTSLFFLLEKDERATLRRKDSDYAELAARADQVSPNALLRPVWQDYLLPTVAYVGGPGELAYLAQSQVAYELLLGRMPVAMSRSGFTILDARSQKLLDRYRMTITQVMTHQGALKERIAQSLVPESVNNSLQTAATEITRQVDRLQSALATFDPTLAASAAKSRAKILYQLEKLGRKTARETLHRDERAQSDARHLSAMLYPHKHPQERFYSILPFLAQHGLDLIDRLSAAVDPMCPDHRVYSL
ncbi:MAG: bacillithiol biosynthesis cysteine-adding enzyme BshC [Acidobacteriota bacterium]|nr:bacillithiol biosynthesis cysteine-adding enzyme BshC [Acidobacteriota bacterium]